MENSVKYSWYKANVPTKQWNEYYSKITGYTFLDGDKNSTNIGFLSVHPPQGCLEITNIDELRKIDLHRRAARIYPFVFEDKN
jgi:hypothetical protein